MATDTYRAIIDEFLRELNILLSESTNITTRKEVAQAIRKLHKLRDNVYHALDGKIVEDLRQVYNSHIKTTNAVFGGRGVPSREVKSALLAKVGQEFSGDVSKIITSLVNDTENVIYRTQVNAKFSRAIRSELLDFADQTQVTSAENIRRLYRSRILRSQAQSVRNGRILINGRSYDYRKYLKLVQNVQTRALQNEIKLERTLKTGARYIIINTTGTGDWCAFYEGRVYALGESTLFPSVARLPNFPPPWHPNCLHDFDPYYPKDIKEDVKEKELKQRQTPKRFLKRPGESRKDMTSRLHSMEKTYIDQKMIFDKRGNSFLAGTLNEKYYNAQGLTKRTAIVPKTPKAIKEKL